MLETGPDGLQEIIFVGNSGVLTQARVVAE